MRTVNTPSIVPESEVASLVAPRIEKVFGEPRNFLTNRSIYLVISQRARGLSIGVNLNPDQACNFNCIYCEVKRARAEKDSHINVRGMISELKQILAMVIQNRIKDLPMYRDVPLDLIQFRELAISGDGEPTLSPDFCEAIEAIVHLRAHNQFPFFKMVLITNGTGLDLEHVQKGLHWFTAEDEIWIKLDAGTQEGINKINRTNFPLEKILSNILLVGRMRPIIIQSLFPLLNGLEPSQEEINEYIQRLGELKAEGAIISMVQIYSAHRPTASPGCRHLSLQCLSKIAQQIRDNTGLKAEVF